MGELPSFWIPQALVLLYMTLRLLVYFKNDGLPLEGKHDVTNELLRAAIGLAVLWWGGFF